LGDRLTPVRLETVGRALADLHTSPRATRRGIENRFGYERIASIYGEIRRRLPSYFRRITRTLDDEVEYLRHYLESKLPKGIIHGDLFPDNLLFRGDKLVAVLDFEAASRGKFIFDLATAVNALCCDGQSYSLPKFEALIAGYESLRPLSLAEWDAFRTSCGSRRCASPSRACTISSCARSRTAERDDKDFRDFYERLRILRRERDGGMEGLLMAMATGYDYRKYQRVKALEKRGSK
jgi:homoserine kinase type II